MSWEGFYLVCFAIGLILSVLSLFSGAGHLHLPHLHAIHHLPGLHGGHSHAAASAARGSVAPTLPWWNSFTLTVFLCWFGGTGYLLARFGVFGLPLVFLLSLMSGTIAGALVFWFLGRVLLRHEHVLTAEETDMRGVVGLTSSKLSSGSTGEILFTQGGARRSAPARSENSEQIDKGTEVVVLRYERGIAYVRRWEELTGAITTIGEDGPHGESGGSTGAISARRM